MTFYYIDTSVLLENTRLVRSLWTRKIHTKLHPGLEWRIFHILTSEDIDDFTDIKFVS